jgi:hypothetical protein
VVCHKSIDQCQPDSFWSAVERGQNAEQFLEQTEQLEFHPLLKMHLPVEEKPAINKNLLKT